MTNYSEIIARLEASEGADRELDAEIARALGFSVNRVGWEADDYQLRKHESDPWYYPLPAFTDPITGPGLCLGLVASECPKYRIEMQRVERGAWFTSLAMPDPCGDGGWLLEVDGHGETLSGAILTAYLGARPTWEARKARAQALAQDTGGK